MESAYIVDSDVFITAKNRFYAFDICPGFWDSVIHAYRAGRLRSIDKVRQELLNGRPEEDLVQWVKHDLPGDFFLGTAEADVVAAFGEVMLWVQRFMHLEVKEKKVSSDKGARTIRKETMIFPRYHQLDAVRKLTAQIRRHDYARCGHYAISVCRRTYVC